MSENKMYYSPVPKQIKELEKKINSLQAVISQSFVSLENRIAEKVSKDEVINSINISQEGIRINGDKIHIDTRTLVDNNFKNSK